MVSSDYTSYSKLNENDSKLYFFFRKYLCSMDSLLFRLIVLPMAIMLLIFSIFFIGYGPTFEIITGYSVRLVATDTIIMNRTEVVYVRKCLDTKMDFCKIFQNNDDGIGFNIVLIFVETFILIVINLYTTLTIWLGIIVYDTSKYVCSVSNAKQINMDDCVGYCRPHCFQFCDGHACVFCSESDQSEIRKCYYIEEEDMDRCSSFIEKGFTRMRYWILVTFGIYLVFIVHVLIWTGGHYNFATRECYGKFGVCSNNDPIQPNKLLVEYFVFELLGLLGFQVISWIIVSIMLCYRKIDQNFKEKYETQPIRGLSKN